MQISSKNTFQEKHNFPKITYLLTGNYLKLFEGYLCFSFIRRVTVFLTISQNMSTHKCGTLWIHENRKNVSLKD